MKLFVIVLCLIPSLAFGADWSTADKLAQTTFISTLIVDWGQTKDIQNHEGHYEKNPILGKHPSDNKVDIYFASCIILHTVVANYIPDVAKKLGMGDEAADVSRKWWQYLWIGAELKVINANYKLGLKMDF
jgi:hypothetical protein